MPDYFENQGGKLVKVEEADARKRIDQGSPIFRKRNGDEIFYVFKTEEEIAAQQAAEKLAAENPPSPPTGMEKLELFVKANPDVQEALRDLVK